MNEEKEQGWLAGERIYEGRYHLMVIHYMPGTWHVIHSSNKLNLSVQESGGTPHWGDSLPGSGHLLSA